LTDFGLAKTLEASLAQTQSSVILGTPLYMAPEQVDGRASAVGPATDVYGLGVILYEVLTGRTPFVGTSVAAVLDQFRSHAPPLLRRLRPDVPADPAVLKKIPLRPGDALDYEVLRTVQKNLAALRARIDLIESVDNADYKDIRVTVVEK
jgi:serine/threonine protein kinase